MCVEVHERARGLAHRWYPGSPLPSARAALKKLLRSCDLYKDRSETTVAPFKFDILSLPETIEGCPSVEAVTPRRCPGILEEEVQAYVEIRTDSCRGRAISGP